jgi:undecaprenyl diphosphate synthase
MKPRGSTRTELDHVFDPRVSACPDPASSAFRLLCVLMTQSESHAQSVGLDPAKLPRHVAIIMDGNGRWARAQGKERMEGHARGAKSVDEVTEECCRLGLGQLTLYCLSSENWKRPKPEIDFLMALLKEYLLAERKKILDQNIRFTVIGRREGLPDEVIAEIEENERLTHGNTGLTLCLAINYGSRAEIVDAVRSIAERVKRGELAPGAINESVISDSLYTAGMPDPDLLIRTAGEMRVSNYLLWQISYAELWVTQKFWPEFGAATLHEALRDYTKRERRFGGLKPEGAA